MALSDKNILITPSVGAATDPTIRFVGGDASSSATITLRVLNSGTVGTLSFEGSSGQLFSLSDTMAGTIFSVNDVSGIPSIEVIDTGEIRMAQYGGFVDILSATSSTSTNSGALQVVGGVGIGGAVYAGNGVFSNRFNNVAITQPASLATLTLGSGTTLNHPATLTFPTTNATTASWVLAMSATANTLQYQAPTTGPTGAQGVQGAQGFQGVQGAQGFQGVQGAQGFQGVQGAQGFQGVQGAQGFQGVQGAQGFQGVQGAQGRQGAQGFQGVQGAQGFQGVQGAVGAQGSGGGVGSQGAQGFQGVQGVQGAQGFQGVQGAVGAQGSGGGVGSQGAQGFQGVQGAVGAQGSGGGVGSQGAQGRQGAQGFQGVQGAVGAQGAGGGPGAQGAQGIQGAQGFQGVQGAVGAQGASGGPGAQGVQGAPGSTAGTAGLVSVSSTVTNATFFPTFVDSNNGSATAEAFYTSNNLSINPGSGITSLNSTIVGGLYTSPTQTLSLSLGTDSWVKLCTLENRCSAKIQIGTGSNNSEEEAEIEIIGTYFVTETLINIKQQSYNNHLREVRVTQVSVGSVKVVYVRLRTTDFAPSINWRLFNTRGFNTLHNIVETPSAGESIIVSTANPINTIVTNATTVITDASLATSTSTGALQVVGGAGIGRDLYVGGAVYTSGSRILPTSIQEFTATGGQTTFTVTGGYTVGSIQVFANGIQLANADFTASNGTTVVVVTPRISGDIIRTVSGLTSSSVNNINALAIAYSVAFGA